MTLRRLPALAILLAIAGCATPTQRPSPPVPAGDALPTPRQPHRAHAPPAATPAEPPGRLATPPTPAGTPAAPADIAPTPPTAAPSDTSPPPPPPPTSVLEAMADAQPKAEPRTRRGNPPVYTVLGQTYRLLPTAAGYRERGVASWYGPDFHAKQTSNGEPYDMYAMSAAHRTLPIPVHVRVTNLANGRSVVVRINDRGPFKHNRIIDLSYTAAMKLGMLQKGTALVEVEAVLAPGDDGRLPVLSPEFQYQAPPVPRVPRLPSLDGGGILYAQVGAYGVEDNARAMERRLREGGIDNVVIVRVKAAGRPLWRVRVGPITSVEQYDAVVAQLERISIREVSLANAEPATSDGPAVAD